MLLKLLLLLDCDVDACLVPWNDNNDRHSLPFSALVGDQVHGSEEFLAMYCERDIQNSSSVSAAIADAAVDNEHITMELNDPVAVSVVVLVFPRLFLLLLLLLSSFVLVLMRMLSPCCRSRMEVVVLVVVVVRIPSTAMINPVPIICVLVAVTTNSRTLLRE